MTDLLKHKRRERHPDDMHIDQLPPHSPEAEAGAIGCQLLEPRTCIPEAVAKLGADLLPAFYDLRHQTIQEHLAAMADAGEPVDLISVQQRLKDRGLLEQVGGLGFLSKLQDAVPSAANLAYYLEVMREKHDLRKLVATCTSAVARVHECEGEVDQLIDEVERDVMAVRRRYSSGKTMRQLVVSTAEYMEKRFATQGALGGLSTGFRDLDRATDGLCPGNMVVLAGRRSAGKTSLALNIVDHLSIVLGVPGGVFSFEMAAEALTNRLVFTQAKLNMRDVRDGRVSEADFMRSTAAFGVVAKAPIYIDDSRDASIGEIRARARRMVQQHGVKYFVIDYLQKLKCPEAKRGGNREQEVAAVSDGIKAMALELGVPVIVLSQLNKDGVARESEAIENDADKIWKLSLKDEEDTSATPTVRVKLDKDRDGPAGEYVDLVFFKSYTKFVDAARDTGQEDGPN